VPNAIVRGKADKRHYVGDQLENCTDFSSLYYRLAFEKVCRYTKIAKYLPLKNIL
jgi:hypothetical protein